MDTAAIKRKPAHTPLASSSGAACENDIEAAATSGTSGATMAPVSALRAMANRPRRDGGAASWTAVTAVVHEIVLKAPSEPASSSIGSGPMAHHSAAKHSIWPASPRSTDLRVPIRSTSGPVSDRCRHGAKRECTGNEREPGRIAREALPDQWRQHQVEQYERHVVGRADDDRGRRAARPAT